MQKPLGDIELSNYKIKFMNLIIIEDEEGEPKYELYPLSWGKGYMTVPKDRGHCVEIKQNEIECVKKERMVN